jgi:hypothetical protein
MRSGRRSIAVVTLLLAVCAGCARRRPAVVQPQAALAPSWPPPSQMAAIMPPLPAMPSYAPRTILLDTTVPPEETAHAHHPSRRRTKPAEAAQQEVKPGAQTPAQAAPAPAQQAVIAPSDMSPIGQLSTANDNANAGDRHDIVNQINSTENDLNAIKRPLSSDEQKTVALIRTYIQHARDALKTDDLDGARTLASKALQLLQELQKQ